MGKINRTGERGINNFGSEMVIVEYRNKGNVDIYFPEYNWIAKNRTYDDFKKCNIKCPYERRYCGVGYLGEGEYKVSENRKPTKVYDTWYGMLKRCYSDKFHKRNPTYINCEVDNEWYNFQNFGMWYEENYYEVEGEIMQLDKDILFKGNKIYSPETCIFVPQTINSLFVKSDKNRGKSVIGATIRNGKYKVSCNMINLETGESKREYLGYYETQEKAFEVYKYYKEKNIKEVADYYKDLIPNKLYNALYEYVVEIND